ncbi:U32 family peptidase [Candidatus Woesearchaeota archaeon]|jgi:putative protease|nr:U32 family peptidase [Candidatus Woesearchaeota archaeon]MBT4835703.1 U32 family peptidase [Candidatus Woesearchaeota archaeon]MBT6735325.1 U32 family peptidase [Candidatus Woesearchaeota archaeon]MBT7169497.1 U32 family peptidase [Candidatus Woesearchaeota archaeon]MBT7474707.1 U32 family peptidase [Candidatus Woesearchaeota archaeon]
MKPEILSPVGDWETLHAAIKAGADAVYFGIEQINMRSASARNFKQKELSKIMETLHKSNMKGYLTLNTLIYEHELDRVKSILDEVKKSKVDAVIATDAAILQLCNEKEIEVHVSTQLSISNYESLKFYAKFSPRIVLARECTLEQIKEIKKKIKKENLSYDGRQIELETFVHGSLCVAYSGRCFMSQFHNRISANRGQCLQECRRKYKIIDEEDPRREFILEGEQVMSPKDLCTLPILDKLVEAGINVFKIEGRAKGPEYVYTVTKAYRDAIDLIAENKFTEKNILKLLNELEKVYNRGFSTNFFLGTPTNDSWTKFYGSIATETKIKIGTVNRYYPKLNVAEIIIEQNELEENETIAFTGKLTGFYKTDIKEIWVNEKPAKKAKKGDDVTVKVEERVRKGDQVFKIKEQKKEFSKFEIHKPFKQSKKKGMI